MPQPGAIFFLIGSAAHFIKKNRAVKSLRRRIQFVTFKIREHLETPSDQCAACHTALQALIAPVRYIDVSRIGIIPGQVALGIAVRCFDFPHHLIGKHHSADKILRIGHHFARFRKIIQHMCSVKTADSGLHADEISGSAIRISSENLRIVPNHIKIYIRQHSDTVATANHVEDSLDGRVGKCRHQILCPFFRMLADILLRCQCMRHFYYLQAKQLFDSPFTQLITPADFRYACCSPG